MSSLELLVLVDDVAGLRPRGLKAQHGFSVLVSVESDDGVHRLLFDVGQDADVLLGNAKILGVDLRAVSCVALSHGHYDHTGALPELVGLRGGVVVVSHPDALKPCVLVRGGALENIGPPFSALELERRGATLVRVREPLEIAPGVYFLGEVPRYRPDLTFPVEGSYLVEEEGIKRHEHLDDTALAIRVEGLGLIVVVGCGHSGVTNVVEHAEKVLKENVYAVVGGFHLLAAPYDKVLEVARILKELGVGEVYPGHCTGLRAKAVLSEEFRDGFRELHTGFTAVFRSRR